MENLPQIVKVLINIAMWLLAAVAAVTLFLYLNPTNPEQPKPKDQGCLSCETETGNNNV